jgi:hypothetical protein
MPEAPEEMIEASRASTRVHDAIAGFDFGCILTLTFSHSLELTGKIALCLFSISLPSIVVSRISYWHVTQRKAVLGKLHIFIEVLAGQIFAVLAFGFLLWQTYWLAALTYAFAVASCVTILYWGMAKHRRRAK